MPQRQIIDVTDTLSTFNSLLATHKNARERLVERRADAIGAEEIARLDKLIAINGRTTDALKRAIETLQRELVHLENASRDGSNLG